MRVVKALGIVTLLALFSVGTAYAAGTAIEGTLVSFNPMNNELVVKTEVVGLMGPEAREVSFLITPKKTTFSICYEISEECYMNVRPERGWGILESYERLASFSVLNKDIKLVRNEAGEIERVDIVYHR